MKSLGDIGEKITETSDNSTKVNPTNFVEVISQPIETFNIEVQKTTSKFKIDTGAPKTLAGKLWIQQYCDDFGIDFNKLTKVKTSDIFILGNDKYPSLGRVQIPVDLVTIDDEDIRLWMDCHMIAKPIELLTGMNTLKEWRAVLDAEDTDIGLKKEGCKKDVETYLKAGYDGHFIVPLWRKDPKDFSKKTASDTMFVEVETINDQGHMIEVSKILKKCKNDLVSAGVECNINYKGKNDDDDDDDSDDNDAKCPRPR